MTATAIPGTDSVIFVESEKCTDPMAQFAGFPNLLSTMNRSHHVLLVEDDPMIAKTLVMSLRYQGFELAVAASAAEARALLAQRAFDLVMFDVGLPDGCGLELCRDLRQRDAQIPILMLSARTDEATVVAGIENGADDYMRKPYGLQELSARLQRLIERHGKQRELAAFGQLQMDVQRRAVAVNGVSLNLGKKEFDVLLLLVRAQGDIVTRNRILDSFDGDSAIYDRTVDSHLSHLRKKLKDAGSAVRIVATYGVGYRLEAA